MPIDPFFMMVLLMPVFALVVLNMISKHLKRDRLRESEMDRDAGIMYQSLPFLVRVEVEKDEKLLLIGRAIIDAAVTVDEFGAAFSQMIGSKKGRREDPAAVQALEDLEAQIAQPQRYHAVELPLSGWHVAFTDETGRDEIACTCDDEWDARCRAAARNIADGPQDDPITMMLLAENLKRKDI